MVMGPSLLAALLAGVYLAWEPPSADFAAQTFRGDLFDAHGFVIWNTAWYGGHYLPAYSLLFPPLAAVLGPRLVGALAAVAAAALFAALAGHRYGEQARLGTLWFGAATAVSLFTGRLTFALGLALGLGSLLALQRRRLALAGALAVLTSLASPVAGLFACIAGAATALAGDRRGGGVVFGVAAAALGLPALAFPSGGSEPWSLAGFFAVPLAAAAVLVLVPREERALRIGTVLYAALAIALFALPDPVGANAGRLGALLAGPVLALALVGRRPVALAVVALPLLYWQWVAPVRDLSSALGDPSVEAGYYRPLLDELDRVAAEPVRVHVPPTQNRWEAVYVAERYPLARGWMRQLESDDFDLFQDGELEASEYGLWLADHGVGFVALSDAELDYLAEDEAALIRRGLPFLRQVWSNEHWRLFEVADRDAALIDAGGEVAAVEPDAFGVSLPGPGDYHVRVRWTPYFEVVSGEACVARDGEWTLVDAFAAGSVRVEARPSWRGLARRDRSCSE